MSRRQAGAPPPIAMQGYKGCFTRTGATAKKYFLAPSGAQGVAISVRLSRS